MDSHAPGTLPSLIHLNEDAIKLNQAWITHPLPETTSRTGNLMTGTGFQSTYAMSQVMDSCAVDAHNTLDRSVVVAITRLEDATSVEATRPARVVPDPTSCPHILPVPREKASSFLEAYRRGDLVQLCNGKFLSKTRSAKLGYSVLDCSARPPKMSEKNLHLATMGLGPLATKPKSHKSKGSKRSSKSSGSSRSGSTWSTPSIPSESNPDQTTPVGQIPTLWDAYHADTLPYKTVICPIHDPRFISTPGKTSFFTALEAKLTDPTGSGALMNLVKSFPNKDVTAINALVKTLLTADGSWREEAAIVRSILLANSVTSPGYAVDPTPLKFLRRTRNVPRTPAFKFALPSVPPKKNEWCFSVCTIDTLGCYLQNKWGGANDKYPSSAVDKTWTVIPLPYRDFSPSSLVPYVASFLDSQLWTGLVNYTVTLSPRGPSTDPSRDKHRVKYTCMPASNMSYVPGPKRFIICLTDTTSQYAQSTIRVHKKEVKVCSRPSQLTEDAYCVDWYESVWKDWWKTANQEEISTHCGFAYNRLISDYAVADTVGRALALASELSAYASYGIGLNEDITSGPEATGAWTYGGGPVVIDTYIKSYDMFAADRTKADIDQTLVGRAFSVVTPWHFLPASYGKTLAANTFKTITKDGKQYQIADSNFAFLDLSVANVYPNSQYQAFTATTPYRLATILGLIDKSDHTDYSMLNAGSLQLYTTGLACALALNTAHFLTSSRFPMNAWTGRASDIDSAREKRMDKIVSQYTLYLAQYTPIKEIEETSEEWAWEKVQNYYAHTAWDSFKWENSSPVCTHYLVQWWQKMNMPLPNTIAATVYNLNRGMEGRVAAVKTSTSSATDIVVAAATTNVVVSRPRAYDLALNEVTLWYDDFQGTSLVQPKLNSFSNVTQFSSCVCSIPICEWPNNDIPLNVFISNSPAFANLTNQPLISVSEIKYPDPPSLGGFLEKVRDYLVFPAVAGGLGFLAGGAPGAVVGATTSVLDAIKTDTARAKLSDATEKISKTLAANPPPSSVPAQPQVEIPKTGTPPMTDSSAHQDPTPSTN